MHWYHLVLVLLPWVIAGISEIMPFTSGKANGILHAVLIALQGAEKVLPPDAEARTKGNGQ